MNTDGRSALLRSMINTDNKYLIDLISHSEGPNYLCSSFPFICVNHHKKF